MRTPDTQHDPTTIALMALAWTLAEPARASRLLDVTGLSAADLRESAGSRATLAALLGFLANHEPDLIACARDIEVKPEALIAAHRELDV